MDPDPLHDRLRGLVQPDQRTCGPASVVAARLLLDPARPPSSFAADVLATHRRLTSASLGGRAQLPWPRALGTPPWAVARAMTELVGVRYRTRLVRLGDRAAAYGSLAAAVDAGRPVPVYIGSRWLPRHVVLAVAVTDGTAEVYDPARGVLVPVTRDEMRTSRLPSRWTTPWFVVQPIGR